MLVTRKYFWPTLCQDVKSYVRGYYVCLASKAICYKPYRDYQFLVISTHHGKNFSIGFVVSFLLLVEWKDNNYDAILVIIDQLTKIVYYKGVKTTIGVSELAEVIIDVVVIYHSLPESTISNRNFLFTLKFWFLLYYFLDIKRRLSITFHL